MGSVWAGHHCENVIVPYPDAGASLLFPLPGDTYLAQNMVATGCQSSARATGSRIAAEVAGMSTGCVAFQDSVYLLLIILCLQHHLNYQWPFSALCTFICESRFKTKLGLLKRET